MVMQKTASSRFSGAVKRIYEWFRTNRHRHLARQHQQLVRKLRGHDNYSGITGNHSSLQRFRFEVKRVWRKWLDRRSNKARMS